MLNKIAPSDGSFCPLTQFYTNIIHFKNQTIEEYLELDLQYINTAKLSIIF